MNQANIFTLFLLFCFSSCAPLIPIMEVDKEKYDYKKDLKTKTICNESNQLSFATEYPQMTEEVSVFFDKLTKQKISLTFIEKLVLVSLLQMKFSPILTSPTSRYMILLNINGQQKYYDFTTKPEERPVSTPEVTKNKKIPKKINKPVLTYLHALEYLLSHYPSSKNLYKLAELIDLYSPHPFKIEKKIAKRLGQYAGHLSANLVLKNYYFHDDDVLITTELLPKFNMALLIEHFKEYNTPYAKSMLQINTELIPFKRQISVDKTKDDGLQLSCSEDFDIYKNSIYKIAPVNTDSNNFSITDAEGNGAVVSIGQIVRGIESMKNTPFILSHGHNNYSILCNVIDYKKPDFNFSLIVTKDRDPAQHVYHMFKNPLEHFSTINDFDYFTQKARFIFLKKPLRILIESKRMEEDKLKEVMRIDGPIYHSPALGEFWSFVKINKRESQIIIDNRYDQKLYCEKDKASDYDKLNSKTPSTN